MKFYITTAIDYVNAAPHLGHAYEKITADVLARWNNLKGNDTFFLTGTDENASKNAKAAKEAGIPTRQFVDKNVKKFQELCKLLNISNNDFIRTTEERHVKVSQNLFLKAYKKGLIYKGFYEGLYCSGCEAFLTEKDLVNGKCPQHDKAPEKLKEESYFFKLSKFQNQILKLLNNKDFILPPFRKQEIINRIKEDGLKDISVSRLNLDWGIPVPFDKKHKIYVWFDAVISYISGIDYPKAKFKKYWPADIHLIGKDILWFHSVIWPGILLSCNIKTPKTIFAHGFINIKGEKLSKSRGKIVNPFELVKDYGIDVVRYYLIKEIPFGEDGDFSEELLIERNNNELANELGNLVNRTLTLAKNKIIKKQKQELKLNISSIEKHMENYELHIALKEIWKLVNEANRYINNKQPWNLKGKELEIVLYNSLESLRIISILLSSFIPITAEKINKQLNIKQGKLKDCKFGLINNYKVKKGEILFKKIK